MLNYNHLYYFYVTVEEESVTAASRRLRISQPALSAQMKQFESKLGEKLFLRSGRKLALTDRGSLVYGFARQMFELSEELMDRLTESAKSRGVRIQLGVTDEVERPFAVRMVSHLFKNRPRKMQPMVKLVSGEHEFLVQKLRDRSLDAILTNHPDYHGELEVLGHMSLPVFLIAASDKRGRDHQPGRADRELFTDLPHALKILRASPEVGLALPASKLRMRKEIDGFLERHKIATDVVFESDMMASISRAIADRVGMGFLPYPYVSGDVSRGYLSVFGPRKGLWQHSVWLLGRQRRGQTSVISAELTKAFERLSRETQRALPLAGPPS